MVMADIELWIEWFRQEISTPGRNLQRIVHMVRHPNNLSGNGIQV